MILEVIDNIIETHNTRTIRFKLDNKIDFKPGQFGMLTLNVVRGGKDKTEKIAKKYGAIVKSNKMNLGLALTFQREMKECLELNADIIVHTDADGQYPAKFIPQIVSRLTEKYTKRDDLVVDPFGGCGTTLVESKVLGRKSIGVDINPVKVLSEEKVDTLILQMKEVMDKLAKNLQYKSSGDDKLSL